MGIRYNRTEAGKSRRVKKNGLSYAIGSEHQPCGLRLLKNSKFQVNIFKIHLGLNIFTFLSDKINFPSLVPQQNDSMDQ